MISRKLTVVVLFCAAMALISVQTHAERRSVSRSMSFHHSRQQ